MTSRKKSLLMFLSLVAVAAAAPETDTPKPNALYVSPIAMWINSAMNDLPVVSLAYERQLTENGLALFVPVHASFYQDKSSSYSTSTQYLLGAGLGLRKFIGHPFSGSYLTLQSDYMQLYDNHDVTQNTSITQFAYGYKWLWSQFVLDMNFGGGFYITNDEKHTYPTAAINLGLPFDADTFGF